MVSIWNIDYETTGGNIWTRSLQQHSLLGIRSARLVQTFLGLVKERVTAKQRCLLQLYAEGKHLTNSSDPFPEVQLDPEFAKERSPLLCCNTGPKVEYKCFVKVMNKRPWEKGRQHMGGQAWRTKAPVEDYLQGPNKKTDDDL
ncbi:hypothetical protein CHARACLAT_031813 [Characodon lateralis]|uniref:Uncharacterized protein n=1 Tax=Characodon lateralis TaxID=208331 RepID=A0ABU7CSY6_9TELE|nr:hypothetical protein [Characodon lateralis]